MHEILVSEEECHRTIQRGNYYAITPMLTELRPTKVENRPLTTEYSSQNVTLDAPGLAALLAPFVTDRPLVARQGERRFSA